MPPDLRSTVLITAFTLVSVSTVVVAVRFYCRRFLVHAVKIYDYLMLLALCVTWTMAVINYYQTKFGTGLQMSEQSQDLETLKGTLRLWYTYQIIYLLDLGAVKFSILTFYRVISSQLAYRIAIYAVMAFVGAFTISMTFVNVFECGKPSNAWAPDFIFQIGGSCLDLTKIYYIQAAFNILSDIVILLLPMPVLYTLHMRLQKRIALIALFSVGTLAIIASTLRVYALSLWSDPDADKPYASAHILFWSQIEVNTAIICASVPSLKPLFQGVFGGSTAPRGESPRSRSNNDQSPKNTSPPRQKLSYGDEEQAFASPELLSRSLDGNHPRATELPDFSTSVSAGAGVNGDTCKSDDEIDPLGKKSCQGKLTVQETYTSPSGSSSERNPSGQNNTFRIMRSITVETCPRLNEKGPAA
ncbi:hypothetical protein VTO42DRAFT_3900 [Malbranchea cinnamomea]